MKKIVFVVALLALAACKKDAAPVPNPQVSPPRPNPAKVHSSCDQDGYYFEKNSVRITDRPIHVVTHKNIGDLAKAYAATHGGRSLADDEIFGFTVIGASQCTIHIIDPAVRYCPSEFGHEMTHCLYGEFHSSQDDAE